MKTKSKQSTVLNNIRIVPGYGIKKSDIVRLCSNSSIERPKVIDNFHNYSGKQNIKYY
jgi:hypothetical protein